MRGEQFFFDDYLIRLVRTMIPFDKISSINDNSFPLSFIMSKKIDRLRTELLKFEAEGREFAKYLRSLEQFIQTVVRRIFGNRMFF